MIDNINNEMIRKIYSKFTFKYYMFNDTVDAKNIIFNLFLYLVNFKFITFDLVKDENSNLTNTYCCIFCVEGECIIIKNISKSLIESIINNLIKNQIILINVSSVNYISIEPNARAKNEILNFCMHIDKYTYSNYFVNSTISSIVGYLINRYYCKPEYFIDKSFLYYDEISEIEIRKRLKDYLLDENESISLDSIFNDIKTSYTKKNAKQCKLKFKENDFIVLREIYSKEDSKSFLVFHIQSFHIFLMKKFSNRGLNEHEIEQSTQFHGFLTENENIIGIICELNENKLFDSYDELKNNYKNLLLNNIRRTLYMDYFNKKQNLVHKDIELTNLNIVNDNPSHTIILSDFEVVEKLNNNNNFIFNLPKHYSNENIMYPASVNSFDLIYYCFLKNHHTLEFEKYFKTNSNLETNEDANNANLNDGFDLFLFFKNNLMNEENLYNIIDFLANFIFYQQKNEDLSFCINQVQNFKNLLLIKIVNSKAFHFLSLGLYYYYGYNVEQNYSEAKKFYELSLKFINSKYYTDLLCKCGENHVCNQNYLEIVEHYKKLTITINSCDYLYLGHLYYYGYGVKKDFFKAKEYYEKSSKLNNSIACTLLNLIDFQ